jgi:hypothetical protein
MAMTRKQESVVSNQRISEAASRTLRIGMVDRTLEAFFDGPDDRIMRNGFRHCLV